MNRGWLALGLVLPLLSAVPAAAQLELDDIRAVRTFPAIEISPSGDLIAYVLDEPGSEGERRSDLWMVATRGEEIRRRTGYGDVGRVVRWSPDGDRIAFLRSADPSAVWLIRPESGAPGVVETELGRIRDMAWSPDGRTLALVAGDGGRSSGEGIYLLEPDRDRGRWILPPERHGVSIAWSPDGRFLAFSAQRESGFYGRLESDLHLLSVEDGSVRALVERSGVDRDPVFGPDGDRIAFVSGFGTTGMLAGLGVSVLDVEAGEVRDFAPTEKGSFFTGPVLVGWSPDGDEVLYEVTDGVRRPLESVSVADAAIRRMSRDSTFYWSSYSLASGTVAFLGERGNRPPELHASPLDAFQPRRLTGVNEFFHALDDVRYDVVEWTNTEGGRVEGMLLLPEGTSEPVPLITILHGGPAVAVSRGFWGMEFFNPYRDDMLASRGYAVFLPNPRGSAGYGTEFMGAVRGDWGTAPSDDVLTGIDRLVERGIADADRLGLMGWSYGGYLTARILTRTDRFVAASVGAGPVNLVSHFALGSRQMLDYFGAPPWEDPEPYLRSSPLFHADRIRTPTLIQHGGEDTAVSPSQAEELRTALEVVGTPVDLVVYEDEGHVIRGSESQERAWETTWEWFSSRLGHPGSEDVERVSLVDRAERFRDLVRQGEYAAARAMMAEDPRRWFAPREGEGRPWRPGPSSGPWSAWDEHFESKGEVVEWREGDRSATAVIREVNDYYRLLERGPVTNEITYFFDDDGRIEGLLIGTTGERPQGKTEEFLAWAREHEPEELEALRPDGEIDPSGDHPERFRALLNRWRVATGRDPIE